MGESLKVGDKVKYAYWKSGVGRVPAYAAMVGTVVEVGVLPGWVRVQWECDGSPEPNMRDARTLVRA